MTTDRNSIDQSDDSNPMGRRAMLGKMAAGGALLWASPLITSTAHAQTTGTCLQSGTLNWSQAPFNNWSTTGTRTASGVIGATGVVATVSDVLTGGYQSANLNAGGTIVQDHRVQTTGGVSYVEFGQQRSSDSNNWNTAHRTATFSFSAPITNVTFHIRDIDVATSGTYQWDDHIAVWANTGTSVARTLTTDLVGNGNGTNNNQAIRPEDTDGGNLSFPGSTFGRANFTISGNVTQITINYWNGNRGDSQVLQQVFISQISFGCA